MCLIQLSIKTDYTYHVTRLLDVLLVNSFNILSKWRNLIPNSFRSLGQILSRHTSWELKILNYFLVDLYQCCQKDDFQINWSIYKFM